MDANTTLTAWQILGFLAFCLAPSTVAVLFKGFEIAAALLEWAKGERAYEWHRGEQVARKYGKRNAVNWIGVVWETVWE